MKRILSMFLFVVILFTMFSALPAFQQTVSADTSGIYTYTVSHGEAMITDCKTSASGDITIPSSLVFRHIHR